MKVIAEAGEKKGCLLIQFPPSVTFNAAVHVNLLLETVVNDEHIKGWRVCVEFRHPSWHCEDTFSLLIRTEPVLCCTTRTVMVCNCPIVKQILFICDFMVPMVITGVVMKMIFYRNIVHIFGNG
ncbi:hypothetical protein L950_0226950 [Sphingobacterium sp. IITKGP-BTPF85]|nr:hypothetical protein L950_0226950 [Sphingobacterium sp. IITKGP-BTPF85]